MACAIMNQNEEELMKSVGEIRKDLEQERRDRLIMENRKAIRDYEKTPEEVVGDEGEKK